MAKTKRRGDGRKPYLQAKTKTPTVKITGGSFDKSDIFIGVAAIAVIAFIVIIGGKGDETSSTIQAQQLGPNLTGSGPTYQSRETEAPSTDTTTPKQNLKEIDDQKFTIGESQIANRLKLYGETQQPIQQQNVTNRPDALIEARREAGSDQYGSMRQRQSLAALAEHNTADLISEVGKKAKKNIKEHAIADELYDKSKIAKSALKENENGIPYHANVGGVPTNDPFDIFSSPEAKIQTEPNIDFTGFGHSKYTAGNVRQYNEKSYPTDGRIFFYEKVPLGSDMAPHRYNKNEVANAAHTYTQVVQQNKQIQLQRNKEGFGEKLYTPLGTKNRYPNEDFLPGKEPDFFKMQTGSGSSELAIANEMGPTGHSWEQRTLKSGIKSTAPAAPDTPLGQGSGAFTRGDDKSNISGKKDADWAKKKVKVRGSVMKIIKLFDRLFSEELFSDAVVDVRDDGKLFIRDGKEGRCILLSRYYEYVENSIKATLGLGRATPLAWGKSIELNFESIEKNKIPLRAALTEDCNESRSYILSANRTIKTADGKPIEINIPWTQDNTILINHELKLGEL